MILSQQSKEKTEYYQQDITIWASEIKRVFTECQWDWLFYSPTTSSLLCCFTQCRTISNAGYGITCYSGNSLHVFSQDYFQKSTEKINTLWSSSKVFPQKASDMIGNGLTSCTFREIVMGTGHHKGENYCSPKKSKKITVHAISIAVSTQILMTHGWQSIVSMHACILEKSAVHREFSGILKQECVRDQVTDPGKRAEAITKPHLESCQNILKNDKTDTWTDNEQTMVMLSHTIILTAAKNRAPSVQDQIISSRWGSWI